MPTANREHLIDGVAKLQPAIFDMHAGVAMRDVPPVDIRQAAGRRAGIPMRNAHALKT
jgi:hypothetical protein